LVNCQFDGLFDSTVPRKPSSTSDSPFTFTPLFLPDQKVVLTQQAVSCSADHRWCGALGRPRGGRRRNRRTSRRRRRRRRRRSRGRRRRRRMKERRTRLHLNI
jgi:hypothetical protein